MRRDCARAPKHREHRSGRCPPATLILALVPSRHPVATDVWPDRENDTERRGLRVLWKIARIAVVVSACAVVTSAVGSEHVNRELANGPSIAHPASDAPQPSELGSPPKYRTPGATGARPTATAGAAATPAPNSTTGSNAAPASAPLPLPITNVVTFGAIGNGRTDDTAAIGKAMLMAEARGGTLYFPPGHYMVGGSGIGSAIEIRGGHAVTIAGAGRDLVTLTNTNAAGGLLSIRVDHTVVEGVTLDARSFNSRQALGAQANYVTVQNARILGGSQFFAIYYAGPAAATPAAPTYNTGNRLLNDIVIDLVQNDGISWSFQENSLIQNLQHTGSRLALYVDRYVTVQNETYHPGPQGGGTAGFWISSPSDHITINNFTSYGMGGIISDNGVTESSNITIANERLLVPGNTLRVDAARGLTIRGCNFGTASTLLFAGSMATTSVVVEDCTSLPMVRFQGSASVSAIFVRDVYPAAGAAAQHRQTFFNFNSAHPVFAVSGGVWMNRAGGFFGGLPATYTVTNLIGYP